MTKAVNATLALNKIQDGYVRLIVTRGRGTLGLDADLCTDPQVIIITDHIALYPGRTLPEGPGNRHGQHVAKPPGGDESAHQIAQLPE